MADPVEPKEIDASKAKSSSAGSSGLGAGDITAAGTQAATKALADVSSDLLKRRQEAQELRQKHEGQLREAMLRGRVQPSATLQEGQARANQGMLNNLPNFNRPI